MHKVIQHIHINNTYYDSKSLNDKFRHFFTQIVHGVKWVTVFLVYFFRKVQNYTFLFYFIALNQQVLNIS